MDFLENLDFSEYFSIVIVVVCLTIGYILKKWIKDLDNKIIPTVCAVLGVALSIWINWGNVDLNTIAIGLVSGLASTGLHQLVKQYLTKEDSDNEV